ncbi:MAG TPA: MarR family transcriptional regulator [Oculatellaceae cyanobacterium]
MKNIEDCISFLIAKAGQQVNKRAREKLARFGVTPTQYAVLKVLSEENGQSAADISARLFIDSATITGIIDRLVAANLVERRADSVDRRVQRLYLTADSKRLQKSLDKEMVQMNKEIAAVLGPSAEGLYESLRHLGDLSRTEVVKKG